jgi:hypothetical protein
VHDPASRLPHSRPQLSNLWDDFSDWFADVKRSVRMRVLILHVDD